MNGHESTKILNDQVLVLYLLDKGHFFFCRTELNRKPRVYFENDIKTWKKLCNYECTDGAIVWEFKEGERSKSGKGKMLLHTKKDKKKVKKEKIRKRKVYTDLIILSTLSQRLGPLILRNNFEKWEVKGIKVIDTLEIIWDRLTASAPRPFLRKFKE